MKKRDELNTIKDCFMRNIGVKSLEEVNNWVRRAQKGDYRIDNLKEAVNFATKFKNKKVMICGDYDCDGVTSTVILYTALTKCGFNSVDYRIPKRFSEGFGLNRKMINEAFNKKISLIITCDNGVAQADVINYAKSFGIAVIIIDHHLPETKEGKIILPNADFIIDPNAINGSADYCGYCGAGLSYRFARQMMGEEFDPSLLGIAALGTVADVMELREENYYIVRYGLKKLLQYHTSGTYALLCGLGLNLEITAHDVAFKIGPVINASSRMNDIGSNDAVRMLLFDGAYGEAVEMAEAMVSINNERKEAKNKAMLAAANKITDDCLYGEVPLVLVLPNIQEGLLGIVAGGLCEKYNIPCIVMTEIEGEILKGSARSCGEYNIKNALDECSEYLLGYGGHSEAAGLSLQKKNFEKFKDALSETAKDFVPELTSETLYDLEIDAKDIAKTIEELTMYEPFGVGNQPIVFKINNYMPTPKGGAFASFIGDGSIVKLHNEKEKVSAIGFDMAERVKECRNLTRLTLCGMLTKNCFGGKVNNQIEFIDFSPVSDRTVTPLASKLASM